MRRLVRPMALVLAVTALAAAAMPWRVSRTTVAGALTGGLDSELGLRAVVAGPVTLKLLPRPRLQAREVSVTAEGGAVAFDAPLLKAELDIPSLLRGVWRLSAATLVGPTLTVDLDRLAARPPSDAAGTVRDAPMALRLRSALLKTRSTAGFADLLATDVDCSATWSGDGEGLTVSGTATLRGTTAQFAGALQHPAHSLTPAGSSASLQITSPLFDAAFDGILSGGSQEQFAGRASLSSASLPKLFRMLDAPPSSPASKRVQISGDLVARPHDLALSNARLRLDRSRFEGTLAWRRDGDHGLVAGTLATDSLDVAALTGDALDRPKLDGLYGEALTASPFGVDLDMRVSATTARLGHVTLEDAAFAALVRGDRLELTLDEARAYGGLVKGRALATLGPDGLDAHADLSAKQVDLGLMSEDFGGGGRVGGAMTARAALDGRGASLRDVVADLGGEGQVEMEGARLAGLSLSQALRRLGGRPQPDAERPGRPTVFDKALWDVTVRGGVLHIPAGRLTAPGVALTFDAETALGTGRVDLHAVAAQADGAGAPLPAGRSMPIEMRGSWAGPLTLVGHGGGLPALTLPLIDGLAPAR